MVSKKTEGHPHGTSYTTFYDENEVKLSSSKAFIDRRGANCVITFDKDDVIVSKVIETQKTTSKTSTYVNGVRTKPACCIL